MSAPFKMNAANAAAMSTIPTLEQAAVDECLKEIKAALDKYNCIMYYQETLRNGQRIMGTFGVEKKPN